MTERANIIHKRCSSFHLWRYLNKRMENGIIIAFCTKCVYVDKKYMLLQKKLKSSPTYENKQAVKMYIERNI